MQIVGVRLSDERLKKLNKLLERTLGKDQVANNTMSDNLRLFIDKLYSLRSEKTLSKAVTKHIPKNIRKCYKRRYNPQVSVSSVCSKCRTEHPAWWETCVERQRDEGVEHLKASSSGKPFKGAIR